MPTTRQFEDAPTERSSPAAWAAAGLLAAACVGAPLALGATAAWPRFATEAAISLAVAVWAMSAASTPLKAFLPLACVAFLAIQLVPLPDRLLVAISPVSAGAWKVAMADSPGRWGAITVDPAATAAALRRLLLAVAAIMAVADLSRSKPLYRLFCGTLCFVCVSIWLLGIAFPFQRKELVLLGFLDFKGPIAKEFWKTPVEPPIATNGSGNLEWVTVGQQRYQSPMWIAADGFGPYIYSNHFAGAMTLTLPVVLGTWLAWSRRRAPYSVRHGVVAAVFAAGIWTLGMMALSRAGAAAMMLAAFVFASLTYERLWMRRLSSALMIGYLLIIAGLSFVVYSGWHGIEHVFPAAVQPRVAALVADSRALAARVALRMFAAAPVLGSGLGTYGELFTRFMRSDFLLNYAHNDYAQWLAETGLYGASLAIGFLVVLYRSFRSWWITVIERRQGDPVTAGVWSALAGLGVHTAYDWNLHIPANALLACVVSGLALASGTPAWQRGNGPGKACRSWAWRLPGFALGSACLIAAVVLARDAFSDSVQRDLRRAIVAARIAEDDATAPPATPLLGAAIAAAEHSFQRDPANAQLAALIGLARLHLSVIPGAVDDPAAERTAAQEWFSKARQRCATCRLPEPLPAKEPGAAR
jgi:O-antigen ligase